MLQHWCHQPSMQYFTYSGDGPEPIAPFILKGGCRRRSDKTLRRSEDLTPIARTIFGTLLVQAPLGPALHSLHDCRALLRQLLNSLM